MTAGGSIPHHVHLVGIAGEGMAALAECLLDKGHHVSGSDRRRTPNVDVLSQRGARIAIGHDRQNLAGAGIVVFSDAVAPSNVECAEARLRDLPLLRRSAFLGRLCAEKRAVFVAGSHGKSTTTAMIATILTTAGLEPSFVIGARARSLGERRGRWSTGDWIVAEACEAFSSLTPLTPYICVVTNVDDDHLEHYGTQAKLDLTFRSLIDRVPATGHVIVNGDDPGMRRVLAGFNRDVLTIGFGRGHDVAILEFEPDAGGSMVAVEAADGGPLRFRVPVPGRHMAANAAAAVACALTLGLDTNAIAQGLAAFSGVERRWRDHGEVGGVRLVEDYAHHPTEVAAAIATARLEMTGSRRLVVAFQPQLVSRTRRLHKAFGTALADADLVLLLDVDPAGEADDPEVHSSLIANTIDDQRVAVHLFGDVDDFLSRAPNQVRTGDFLLVVGAGSIASAIAPLRASRLHQVAHNGHGQTDGTTQDAPPAVVSPESPALAPVGTLTRQQTAETSWRSLADIFSAVAREHPDAPAVSAEGGALTYAGLDTASDECARLLRDHGVGRGSVVAVGLPSACELPVIVVALAKIGGVYLPLDAALPTDRARFMLTAADAALVVVPRGGRWDRELPPMLRVYSDLITSAVARRGALSTAADDGSPEGPAPQPDDVAYICFTSGSTGRPKGVMISHRSLAAFTVHAGSYFAIGPGARLALNTAIGFDVSVGELWLALGRGACLTVTGSERPLVGTRLGGFIERSQTTHLAATPSVLRTLPDEKLPVLRCIIAAGEACPPDLVRRWAPSREFFNAYGPTEATIYATAARCTADGPVTIGTALGHVATYVVDESNRGIGTGDIGELCLGGDGVAAGYLRGSPADDERFHSLVAADKSTDRVYRTGDLVRLEANGSFTFAGRRDRQVKLLGYRIELDEIESAICASANVRDAAVCLRDVAGGQEVIAFVAPTTSDRFDPDSLRRTIAAWLPPPMVPQTVIEVPSIPISASGKKDRQRLLESFGSTTVQRPFFAPGRTELETQLARIWADVLIPRSEVGVYDDYRSLGGDSLKSLLLIAAIEEAFNITIPPGFFERFTTIVDMAVLLEDLIWRPVEPDVVPADPFHVTRIYQQQRHLTAGWSGARVSEHGLIRTLGETEAATDLFVCVQYEHESIALHRHLAPDVRVHGMRSGHLLMAYTESNVEQLASQYFSELQAIAPRSRVVLAGVCQGGTIAFALARKLASVGRHVDLLILIEQSRLPDYDGRLAFIYSQTSFLNPATRFDEGEAFLGRAYGGRYSLDLINGNHGDLFAEPQIVEVATRLRERIAATL